MKPKTASDISPTFCVMPWVGITTHPSGGLRPCCWISNVPENKFFGSPEEFRKSDYLNKIKREMLEGTYPKICNKCQREEEAGVKTSRRLRHNEMFVDLIPDILEKDPGLQFIDLRLANTCNLGCVMCNPTASSYLKKETETYPDYATAENLSIAEGAKGLNLLNAYSDADISQLVDAVTPTSIIYFAGGEPGLMKSVYTFLDTLIERGLNRDVKLFINSNFQVVNPRWFDILSHFRGIMLPSIDGVGIRAEFVRYPCKWESVVKNIDEFIEKCPDFLIRIQPAVSMLNLFDLPGLFAFVRERPGVEMLLVNKLYYPTYFDICNLPDAMKDQADTILDSLIAANTTLENERDQLKDVKRYMRRERTADIAATVRTLNNFSKIRGLDWRPALPELIALETIIR
jgi:organic radical activating enzyme